MPVTSQDLLKAIGTVIPHTVDSTRFESPEVPGVFVDPEIETEEAVNPFAAQVILIEAPAAVGKSTVARYVASRAGIPLLDLARVPVAAGSLRGLIGGYVHSDPPSVDAWLSGDLALVIDALDEGRIRSGEESFTEFLFTTWELLDNAKRDSGPILILFGRPTTVGDVEASLELHDGPISYTRARLAFFDEASAVELVKQNAQSLDKDPRRIDRQWGAISVAVSTYFSSIARALGLQQSDDLWTDELGRSFAGYAPVLGAVGALIAETSDFQSLTARLNQDFENAWAAIEEVIRLILDREVRKLQDAVRPLLSDAAELDTEVYSPDEQLHYLIDHVQGERALRAQVPAGLRGRDADAYVQAVNQQIHEHPFVRERRFANPVLAGFALALAIERGWLDRPPSTPLLNQASRSPFLWRSFSHRVGSNTQPLSGVYVGYLLSSRWNDPGEPAGRVELHQHRAHVRVSFPEWESHLLVSPPIRFFERIRDVVGLLGDAGDVTIELAGEAMTVSGPVALVAPEMAVTTEKVFLEGSVWLEAEQFESRPNLSLTVDSDAEVGWNGAVNAHYPWSHAQVQLVRNPLVEPEPANKLEALIVATTRHAPSHSVVVDAGSLHVAQDEPRWGWIQRDYNELFRMFLRILIEEGLAEARRLATSGTQKKARVTFAFRWSELAAVARGSETNLDLQRVLERARVEFPQRLLYP